jgi:hypothetical protein
MTTATAQAFSNIAFIKYWGKTENIGVAPSFLHNFWNSKTGEPAMRTSAIPVLSANRKNQRCLPIRNSKSLVRAISYPKRCIVQQLFFKACL